MNINKLHSGGIITNYFCSSRCRHCLYNCSPSWPKDYINEKILSENIDVIKSLGCDSVHIGGGEPFLNIEKLKSVLKTCSIKGMGIEYIETNSSWYNDTDQCIETLQTIKSLGVYTLLISISPFHNENIPFKKVKGLINACYQTGINVFPWSENFYHDIDGFDENKTHTLEEYQEKFGEDYIKKIPSRYWISYGGRAIQLFSNILQNQSLSEILDSSPCYELAGTSHFHFDLFGNYIPGLCSGLVIKKEDLGKSLPSSYQIIYKLFTKGIKELYTFCKDKGFEAKDHYLNKCHLCLDIRKFLVQNGFKSPDLSLKEFYQSI